MHIFNILDFAWPKWMKNNTCCLSYTANIIPTDALVTLGSSASAAMVLTSKARIFHLQHQKSQFIEPREELYIYTWYCISCLPVIT